MKKLLLSLSLMTILCIQQPAAALGVQLDAETQAQVTWLLVCLNPRNIALVTTGTVAAIVGIFMVRKGVDEASSTENRQSGMIKGAVGVSLMAAGIYLILNGPRLVKSFDVSSL